MKAYQLIEKPENWTQHCCARDEKGVSILDFKFAFSFCMLGAILHANPDTFMEDEKKVCLAIDADYFEAVQTISSFNDSHTHIECYELLKKLDV